MSRIASIKIVLFFAALVFIAKPFIGFGLSGHLRSHVKTNIFVKAFSKRKIEDSRLAMNAIEKLLTSPLNNLFLRFSFLLSILFPLAFTSIREITGRFLRGLSLRLLPRELTLLTGQLII